MLQLSNVSKRYGDVTVLKDVSFVVNPGDRVGLIGPNGCGKTTILRIAAGLETLDAGSVHLSPPDLRMGILDQGQHYQAEETLAAFLQSGERALEAASERLAQIATALAAAGSKEQERLAGEYDEALAEVETLSATQTARHELEAAMAGLGLGGLPLETPVAILSGGQKTRLGLARILARRPHVLLLDEPTNHLDVEALEWLEAWLRGYAGAALVVSHDRTFLDQTVSRILDVDPHGHTVAEYTGNYSDYIEAWEQKRERQWAEYRDQVAEIERLKRDAQQTKQRALRAEATSTLDTERRLAKKAAKKAKVKERRLERYLDSPDRVEKPARSWQIKLGFDGVVETGKDVLVLDGVAAGYDGIDIVSGISQVLRAGERVVLTGPNGGGKTTLLRTIAGLLEPIRGEVRLGANVKVGYYAQEQETLDPNSTPFETITRVAPMSETDARTFLHYFLFAGDEVFVPVGSLSFGERARLVLARLVATGCNFLLLDEPINHLDIPGRARFEQAMQAFERTVLAVVHDRYFIRRFATRLWYVRDGVLQSYIDLDEMRRVRRYSRLLSQPNTPDST